MSCRYHPITFVIIKFHSLNSIEINAYQGTAYEGTTPLIDFHNTAVIKDKFEVMMDIFDFFSMTKYMPYGS